MRNFLILMCLIAAPALRADIPKPVSLNDTLALMLEHLRTDFPDAVINLDSQNIALDAEGQMVVNPDNLHAILQNIDDGAAREAELERFLDTLTASIDQAPLSDGIPLDRVYPVVRHESFAQFASGDAPSPVTPFAQPFVGDMVLVYAIDYPDHVAYVTQAHLDDNQISIAQLDRAADLNLSQKLDETQFQQQGGTFMIFTDGFYESSMVLDAALWADISRQLGDDLVMIAPARDVVAFTTASNKEEIDFLQGSRDNILANGTHQLSDLMYLWKDGRWQVLSR